MVVVVAPAPAPAPVVVAQPATPVVVSGGVSTVSVVGPATPVTQTFTPPQEIVLRSAQPATQVFTPPQRVITQQVISRPVTRTVVRTVVRTVPRSSGTFTPPSSTLPFSGFPVAAGLIVGIALLGSGALLLFRRRSEWAQQAAALAALRRH